MTMDFKLIFLALVVLFGVFYTVESEKVECFDCELTIIDGDKDGKKYCETGEDTIRSGKTTKCKKGCTKIYYKMDIEFLGAEFEAEFYERGCSDEKKDRCRDEGDLSALETAALETALEATFDEVNLRQIDFCQCKEHLCNGAPNARLASIYGVILAAMVGLYRMV